MTAALFEANNSERRPEGIEIARIRPQKIDTAVDSLYLARGVMVDIARQQQPAPVEVPQRVTGQIMKSEVQPEVLRKDATRYHQNRVTQDAVSQAPAAPTAQLNQQTRPAEVVDPIADAMAKVKAAHGAQAEQDEARARLQAELGAEQPKEDDRIIPFEPYNFGYEPMDERAA